MKLFAEYVERAGILVRAKQPFYDWANTLEPGDPINIDDDPIKNVYLIDADAADDDPKEVINVFYEVVFNEELTGFTDDEALWPKDRSLQMFEQWFSWEILDMAFDILDEDDLEEDEEGW